MQTACLGLHFLGSCQYDPEKPTTYFTMGQLVSVMALLVTFLNLAKPIVLFRLKAARVGLPTFYSLGAFVFLSVLIAGALPFIPYKPWPLVGYPVFWEFLGGITFIGGSVLLIMAMFRPAVFRPGNAKAYLDGCKSIIAKGNEEVLTALAEEIEISIRPIVLECRRYLEARRNAEAERKPHQPSYVTRTAFTLFEIWSDKEFCRCIVCKVPSTAITLFEYIGAELNEADLIYQIQPGRVLCAQLLQQAFQHRGSILYREEHYSGLGLFQSFTRAAFANYKFVDGSYRPLQAWRRDVKAAEPWQVKRYVDCIYIAFEALCRDQLYKWTMDSLWAGLNQLTSETRSHVLRFNQIQTENPYETACFDVAEEIADLYVKLIDMIASQEQFIPDTPAPDKDHYPRLGDRTIYGVLARGIFEFFDRLSHVNKHEDAFRMHTLSVWQHLVSDQNTASRKAVVEITSRLIIELERELDTSLGRSSPTFPWITRLLIALIGLKEPSEIETGTLGQDFAAAFLRRLKANVPKVSPDLVKNVLPSNVVHDQKAEELRMYDKGHEIGKLKLE